MKNKYKIIATLLAFCLAGTAFAVTHDSTISPIIKSEFIFNEAAPTASECHASTIVETPMGLVAAWHAGKGGKDPRSKIYVSKLNSHAGGWTEPVAMVSLAEGVPFFAARNPVLFQQKNGPLLLFCKAGKDPRSWRGMLSSSSDGGKTWSEPRLLPEGILGPTKNKPIEQADGTLLCPSSVESRTSWKVFVEGIRPLMFDDFFNRVKWAVVGPMNEEGLFAIQPTLLDLGQGSLLMLCRSKQPNPFLAQPLLEARSTDGGNTWTRLRPTALSNPNSGIDAVTLTDGRCLLVSNPTRTGRTPLSVAVSADQGKTWNNCLTLESQPGEYSYPAIIQSADGLVHITYTWRNLKIKHVVVDPKLILDK